MPKNSPGEQVKQMAELGFLGMMVDPKIRRKLVWTTISYVLVWTIPIDAQLRVIVSVQFQFIGMLGDWKLLAKKETKRPNLSRLSTRTEHLGAF